jgi:uncharacterized OB-fold protein
VSPLQRPEPRKNVYEAPFWDFVQRHDLRLQRCSACGSFWYPPGPMCSRCLSNAWEWVALRGEGRLVSWVVFHRQYFPELPVPYHVAAVETAEGPLLIANLINLRDTQLLRVDLPVRLVYETAITAAGEAWEIYQWAPA